MMGHSHAMSGLAVGAATLPWAPVPADATQQIAWVAAWGGFALLPDLDAGGWKMRGVIPKGHGSTVARMWGPVTITLAAALGKVARGHRNGTHDFVIAPLAFGAVAVLAGLHPFTSMLLLAFAIGLALHACHLFVPGGAERTVIGNVLLSFGGAAFLLDLGESAPWLPFAVAGGVLVHIAGDALTYGGCPYPLTWLDGKPQRYTLGLFKTGAWQEKYVLAPLFLLAAIGLVALHTGVTDHYETVRTYLEAHR